MVAQHNTKAHNDILALEEMGNQYYEEGHFSLSEQSFLKAKENAKSLKDLDLEIKITGNYTAKFINIRSIAKSLELVLELKERVIEDNNDSLLFKVYGMISQQYGTLGQNLDVRMAIADSMLIIAKKLNQPDMLRRAYFQLGTATEGDTSIAFYRICLKFCDWEKDKKFISSI